ncbi:MAG TPA: DNA-binding domain-containing protein [Anaeromyxobacteraceae bacterium]|nr:DNA-binding domain-containing protein [Anaeromyxobacteraceae bacterium]
MTLAETQALFAELVRRGPEADPAGLEACLAGTPGLPAAERVGIYAGMYLGRQVEALREEFPRLAGLLGEERFLALCRAYLSEHPSEHHDIGQLGRELAGFLRREPDPHRPDLADLAELEWTRSLAFGAAEAEAAGPEAFAGLAPEAFAAARIRLAPSLHLLHLGSGAASLWSALEAGEEPGPPLPAPTAVAVWRSGHRVLHAALGKDEARALAAALAGEPVERICAAFAGDPEPAAAAHAALSSWIEEGWVSRVEGGGTGGGEA